MTARLLLPALAVAFALAWCAANWWAWRGG